MRCLFPVLLLALALPAQASKEAKRLPPLQCLDAKGRVVVPAAAIRRVGHGVSRPELVKQVIPDWPRGPYGTTILESVIDASGGVCAVRVLRAPSKAVGDATMTALREFKFRPARFKGRPVAVLYTLTVTPHIQ
jgi:hypothetical protein